MKNERTWTDATQKQIHNALWGGIEWLRNVGQYEEGADPDTIKAAEDALQQQRLELEARHTVGQAATVSPKSSSDPHAPDNRICAKWSDEHDAVVIAADDDVVPEDAQRAVREFHEAFLEDDITPPAATWYYFEAVADAEREMGRDGLQADITHFRHLELDDDGQRVVLTEDF